LNYYANSNDDLELKWFYTDLKKSPTNGIKSSIFRVINGIINYAPFIKYLKKELDKDSYKVAHFSTSGGMSFFRDFLALKACKKRGVHTILHFHFGRLPQILHGSSLEHKLFDMCVKYTDVFVAIDQTSYNALSRYGIKNLFYLPNPLAPKVEKIIESTDCHSRNKNLVLYVGHVYRSKGVFELVEACKNIENAQLEIIGECAGDIKDEIMRIASTSSKSEWLNIRGNCTLSEVIAAMKRCAVFVLPSYSEGFPNVIIESMACACPIVATNVGAIPEMLDISAEQCGVIVEPKDVANLLEAIKKILNDDSYAQTLGEKAKLRVRKEYSMGTVWKQLLSIWNNV
jgi:glycosyltransferase involved in cell wall biosynthesis